MNPETQAPASVLPALTRHRVWNQLDPAALAPLAPQWQLETAEVGTPLLPQGRLHSRTALILSGAVDLHRGWIEGLLREYYDPMYVFQREKKGGRIEFAGERGAVIEYLRERVNQKS